MHNYILHVTEATSILDDVSAIGRDNNWHNSSAAAYEIFFELVNE